MPDLVVRKLISILPEKEHKHLSKYLWVVDRVLKLQTVKIRYKDQARDGFVPLHSRLISAAVTADFYKRVMGTLKSSGILLCNEHYTPESLDPENAESKGYKINAQYMDCLNVEYPADKAITRRVIKCNQNNRYEPKFNHEKHLKKQLQSFTIDASIFEYIENKYVNRMNCKVLKVKANNPKMRKHSQVELYLTDLRLIKAMNSEDSLFHRDSNCMRIFTVLNLMRKEYRKFWRHSSGSRLVELDIRNAQPLILCTLFPDHFASSYPEDVKVYEKLCSNGTLYEYMAANADCSVDGKARDKFKKKMMSNVFYCPDPEKWTVESQKGWYYTKFTQYFEQNFPFVYELICKEKPQDNYAQLSIKMMRREADLMIDTACKNLMLDYKGNVPLTPIHDSLVTTEEYAAVVKAAILNAFESKHGLTPSIRVKYLDNGQLLDL